ncbi:RICIN domain-containing protein [Tenacibaculum jejuense]|uniref:GH16 domain-containing protein n=1 Tax=Tenacibaculum jejuense TaxID=584609 RepID=A0A238UE43_9FLAO|nr:RICIN domain-containing protein [Tenacibaculum jejuense]SNR17473.1 Protein of unknown function precursor containing a C-terminal secretion signal. Probable GH16 and CBM13 containing protein. Putative beta-porphyranase [Tenacibaculum jejuense]
MKKIILFFVCTILPAVLLSQTPTAPSGKRWQKVNILSDEFNGDKLDETKWDDYHPHWSGRPPSAFKKGNAFVEGGYLKLRSTLKRDPSTVNNPLKNVWVNSAACVSKGWDAKPGYYYEAKFKASSLSMTSSFWFRVGDFSEIDVIEHIGNPSIEKRQKDLPFEYAANTHYYGKHKGLKNKKAKWKMPTRGRDGFHTYGFWWKSANELLFYYDGKEVMKIVPRVPFNENLKMIFDTEVFPFAQAGVPSIGLPKVENLNDNSKNTMMVDWVRVYELKDEEKVNDKISFKNTPTDLSQETEYTFDIEYTAATDREIVVGFYKDDNWVASGKVNVGKGRGVASVKVILPELPVAGNGYSLKSHIRPLDTTWRNAIDNDEINNVSISKKFSQIIPNGTYYITSASNSQRLLSRALENHSARMHDSGNFNDQRWIFTHINNNVYTIQNKLTLRYLEVPFAKCENGTDVATWKQAIASHQQWQIVENSKGSYSFKPMHCPDLALDRAAGVLNANVQIWNYNKTNANQQWKIIEDTNINNRNLLSPSILSKKIETDKFLVYPNPSKEVLYMSGLNVGDEIAILNIQGQEILTFTTKNKKEVVSIGGLSKGIYLIRKNNKSLYRFIKE